MAQPYRYVQRQGYRNVPTGQRYDFWKDNPWQNMFQGQSQNYGNLGNQFLNPYAGADPSQLRTQFGYRGGVGPNDPALGQWTAQMRGNVGNALREGVNRQANAGVAASRGGYSLPGGDLRSVLAQQANQQVAGMASDNFRSAVDYENQRRQMDNYSAQALADFARSQMQTGLGLMGLQLQGTQAADASLARWQQNAGNAFGADTDLYNQLILSEPQRMAQQRQQNYAEQQMNRESDKQNIISRLLAQGYGGGYSMPWTWEGFKARGYLDKMKSQGLL